MQVHRAVSVLDFSTLYVDSELFFWPHCVQWANLCKHEITHLGRPLTFTIHCLDRIYCNQTQECQYVLCIER